MLHPNASPGPGWGWDALCGIRRTLSHCCLLHSVTSGGAVFPMGVGGHCAPARCHHLCQDGTRMLSVPSRNSGTVPAVLCHLRPASSAFPAGTGEPCSPGPCRLHSITATGRDAPHSRRDCVSGLVSAVCLQSAPEPRAAGPGASPSLEKGERERRRPEPGSAARRAAAGAGRWHLPSPAQGDTAPWGHGDTAPPWPGCSPSCSSRLWAARPGRAGGRRRGTMEQMVIVTLGTPAPLGTPFPPGCERREAPDLAAALGVGPEGTRGGSWPGLEGGPR